MIAPASAVMAQSNDQDTGTSTLDEVVVTAQRRSERLQDVPIAITAANAETLAQARVENISNIGAISPSIQFRASNNASSSANVVIRGLGTTGNSRSFEGGVGIFIDGVYRTRAASALQNFLDIDSVQVLRGPQGTLFGKNTSAGAVLIDSTRPNLTRGAARYEASSGNDDVLNFKAALNVPITEGVSAIRLAVLYGRGAGYVDDVNTGEDVGGLQSKAVKAQFLLDPGGRYSLQLIGDYSISDGNCCYGTIDYINGPTQPVVDALTVAAGRRVPSRTLSDRQTGLSQPTRQEIEDYGITGILKFNGLGGDFKSTTALREFSLSQKDSDGDFAPADIFNFDEAFNSRFVSQELTYSRTLEAIDANLILGGFASHETLEMSRSIGWGRQGQAYVNALLSPLPAGTAAAPAGVFGIEGMGGRSHSAAVFAHLDTRLNSKFNLIVGARYSREEKDGQFAYDFFTSLPNAAFRLLRVAPGPSYDETTVNKAFSGTLGLQFKPTDNAMLYLTYNRGFKAGGVNMDANAAGTNLNNPAEGAGRTPLSAIYQPETINALEAGGKFEYFGRRARTNVAAFYNDISDLQVAQFIGLRFTVLNAASAETYGAEIENLFELASGVSLGVDATWVPHADYGVDPALGVALSGQRFRYASKLTGNVSLNLDVPVAEDLSLIGRAQYQYSGEQFINTASDVKRGDVGTVNLNIGLRFDRLGIQAEAWMLNAGDETYPTLAFNTPLQTGDQNAYLAPPRTFGVTVRATF